MKNLFKLLLAGTFLFTFAAKSFSQTTENTTTTQTKKATPEEKAVRIVNEMAKIATLTEDQIVQIKPLVLEFLKQKEIDNKQFKGNEEALTTARNTRFATYSAKIKTIVTDEQYTKLIEFWDNKKKANTNETK